MISACGTFPVVVGDFDATRADKTPVFVSPTSIKISKVITIENSPNEKDDSLSSWLDDLLERFEDVWNQVKTSPPLLELFLEDVAAEDRSVVLIELMKIDMEHRWHRVSVDNSLIDSSVGVLPWRVTIADYYDYFHAVDKTLLSESSLPELWEEQFRVQWRFGERVGTEEFLASLPQQLLPTDFLERLTRLEKTLVAEFNCSESSSPETELPETFPQSSVQRSTASNVQKLTETMEVTVDDIQRSGQPPANDVINDATAENNAGRPFGKFRLFEELGRGGFGVVYRAHDISLNCDVALKIPKLTKLSNPEIYEQFFQEAEAMAQLDHPHIVPVFSTGVVDDIPYIASALAPLGTLTQWLSQPENSLTIQQIIDCLICVSRGVEHAHQNGTWHRDLKPGNLLVWPNNLGSGLETNLPIQLRISDFGLAKLTEQTETGTSTIIGTLGYMAPEQFADKYGEQGAKTDIFALGVILYELLTDQKPFPETNLVDVVSRIERGESPVALRKMRKEIPRDLEIICMKCLQVDPVNRYATANELCNDLERVKNNQPISTKRRSLWNRFEAWSRHSARIRDAGAFAVATGCGLLLWTLISIPWNYFQNVGFISLRDHLAGGAFIFFSHYGPQIWLGQRTLARKKWAIYGGVAHTILLLCIMGTKAVLENRRGIGVFKDYYDENTTAKILVLAVLMTITFVQLTGYLLALRASRHQRRSET